MKHEVTNADTAIALGSGEVPVLGTPRLVAWLEAATLRAAAGFLAAGQTTVGAAIRIDHRRPTPVGGIVETTAEPPEDFDGRRLTFIVRATDDSGRVVADGEIDRVIVDRDGFTSGSARPR